jgi:hypothetical protein
MGREIKRVPLDFDQPLSKVWPGYLSPDKFDEDPCPDCKGGYSPRAEYLHALWYGNVPFEPADTGSTPLRYDSPGVRAFAERNIGNAPDYYGTGELAIVREGQRLADLWNGMWCHHLTQADVDALVEGGRLRDFTHSWDPKREPRFQLKEPPAVVTAAEVNDWSLRGLAHDGINAMVVVRARCEREGVGDTCPTCEGHGSSEAYPGQRAEAEAWERTEPPEGEGWQLWETVSEGSPISPVCKTPESLARWMSSDAYSWGASRGGELSYDSALAFIKAGWAPSFVATPATGLVSGVEFAGHQAADG